MYSRYPNQSSSKIRKGVRSLTCWFGEEVNKVRSFLNIPTLVMC